MLNRSEKENVLRWRLSKVSAGGDYDDLKFGPIKAGEIYQVNRLAVENESNAFTEIRLFVDGRGYNHYLEESNSPAKATLFWITEPFFLFEGETLVVRCTGCTNLDKLFAYLEGVYIIFDKKVK